MKSLNMPIPAVLQIIENIVILSSYFALSAHTCFVFLYIYTHQIFKKVVKQACTQCFLVGKPLETFIYCFKTLVYKNMIFCDQFEKCDLNSSLLHQ